MINILIRFSAVFSLIFMNLGNLITMNVAECNFNLKLAYFSGRKSTDYCLNQVKIYHVTGLPSSRRTFPKTTAGLKACTLSRKRTICRNLRSLTPESSLKMSRRVGRTLSKTEVRSPPPTVKHHSPDQVYSGLLIRKPANIGVFVAFQFWSI